MGPHFPFFVTASSEKFLALLSPAPPLSHPPPHTHFLSPHIHADPKTNDAGAVPLDFSDAQAKIKEDENRRRVEEGLATGLTKEVRAETMLLWASRSFVMTGEPMGNSDGLNGVCVRRRR